MVAPLKVRVSKILGCDVSQVPDSLKDIRKAIAAKKPKRGVKK